MGRSPAFSQKWFSERPRRNLCALDSASSKKIFGMFSQIEASGKKLALRGGTKNALALIETRKTEIKDTYLVLAL